MKFTSFVASLALLLAATLASAQTSVEVSASGGSVAARGSSGGWAGLEGSASRATINFSATGANSSTQFKFATTPAGVQGTTYQYGAEVGGGAAFSSGGSTVTSGAIDYYKANWTANLSSFSLQSPRSGTFDPYDVTYGDVIGATGPQGGSAQLYFQSSLSNAFFSQSDPTLDAAYTYSLSVTDAFDNPTSVLSLSFSTATGLDIDFNENSGIQLFLLGANADDPTLDPTALTNSGTRIRTQADANGLARFFGADGNPTQSLSFGLLRTVEVASGGNPDDRLFAWHADTTLGIDPAAPASTVPGPMAALPFALLALRRRRRA